MKHERIDATQLSARDTYRMMTDLVSPRPIAWVSTLDEQGRANLAPFSYFQAVCSKPPMIVVSIGWHPDGRPKDTLRGILDLGEFTVNHVSDPLAEAMNETSGSYPPETSEWDVAADGGPLASEPSHVVRPPRVAQAKAALECRLVQALPLGRGPSGKPSSTLVVAEVVCFSVAPELVRRNERGHLRPIDPAQLASVGRMGGIAYTHTNEPFELVRPVVEDGSKLPSSKKS